MPRTVLPHQFFRMDFDIILKQAKRQDEIDPVNKGEYNLVQDMHTYFYDRVLPAIAVNDWVYDAASRFASEFAIECFRYMRLGADPIYECQVRLLEIKDQIHSFIERARLAGWLVPLPGDGRISQLGGFLQVIDVDRLPDEVRREALALQAEAHDHSYLHLEATLDGIRGNYERLLPRVMYVVRRVIKTDQGLRRTRGDENLQSISESLQWFNDHVSNSHPLYPVLGALGPFYKVARNVGSHHHGLEWDGKGDEIVLRDDAAILQMPIYEFQQKFRYIVYMSELGMRGILSAFCEREQGKVSNWLVEEYDKIFPDDFPEEEPDLEVKPYSV